MTCFCAITPNASMSRSPPYRWRYPGPDDVYNMKPELDGHSCCGMTFLHMCEKSGKQARPPSWFIVVFELPQHLNGWQTQRLGYLLTKVLSRFRL
jgi:hypothetical protein